mmetsp:Transcript_7832/g.20082  ORF Transcript_7832/g.20082 Transcript_7832/m.20082 type:complete len:509 (-) Transcript_7832:77-1603(-)
MDPVAPTNPAQSLVEDVGEGLEVAHASSDPRQRHPERHDPVVHVGLVAERHALPLLGLELLVRLDGLLGESDMHHGREDVDDGTAKEGAREGGGEAEVAHLERDADGDRHGGHGDGVKGRLRGGLDVEKGEGASAEPREDEGEPKDDGREHADAREEGEGVARGVVVEDQAHRGAAEGEESRGHDQRGDEERAEEARLCELGELGEAVANHGEKLGGVIVRHVGRVEHGDEDEGLEGGGAAAERGPLRGAQRPEQFCTTRVGPRKVPIQHKERAVEDAGDAEHGRVGQEAEVAQHAEGEDDEGGDRGEEDVAVGERARGPKRDSDIPEHVPDDDGVANRRDGRLRHDGERGDPGRRGTDGRRPCLLVRGRASRGARRAHAVVGVGGKDHADEGKRKRGEEHGAAVGEGRHAAREAEDAAANDGLEEREDQRVRVCAPLEPEGIPAGDGGGWVWSEGEGRAGSGGGKAAKRCGGGPGGVQGDSTGGSSCQARDANRGSHPHRDVRYPGP